MNDNKKEILIIDDSVDAIKVLIKVLSQYYTVYFAKDGVKGIELAKEKKPDLILLDIMMDNINGYEVCRRLKLDKETTDIPVIFLTAVSESMDEAKAFEVGGADYITKPFVPIVVLARISNHIKLSEYMKELKKLYNLALDANPITGMPGNNSIKKAVEAAINENIDVYVFYADLDNFKAYNDNYGFANGDKVILFTSSLFQEIAKEYEINNGFWGHIGGDDFVYIIDKSVALEYTHKLIEKFDADIKEFYNETDVSNGYISAKSRSNEEVKYPLVSISIAGVDLSGNKFSNYLQINDICTELKGKAKKVEGSCLVT